MSEKIVFKGITIEMVDGVLSLSGVKVPVEINQEDVFSLNSIGLLPELNEYFIEKGTSFSDYFSEKCHNEDYTVKLEHGALELEAIVPRNAEYSSVRVQMKDIIDSNKVLEVLDYIPYYEDKSWIYDQVETQFAELWQPVKDYGERFGIQMSFIRKSFSTDLTKVANGTFQLKFSGHIESDNGFGLEELKTLLSRVAFYDNLSKSILNGLLLRK